jgi:hypothetical protein
VSELARSRRSQAWFPGKYVPVSHIHGAEIFTQPRGGVRIDRTTIHGTAAELRDLGAQLVAAADRLDGRRTRRGAENKTAA